MEGLFEEQDMDLFEACFMGLEPLIKRRAHGLLDCGVELAKILLSLENRFCLQDFDTVKMQTLVALCCEEPITVSAISGSWFQLCTFMRFFDL